LQKRSIGVPKKKAKQETSEKGKSFRDCRLPARRKEQSYHEKGNWRVRRKKLYTSETERKPRPANTVPAAAGRGTSIEKKKKGEGGIKR